ncbi:MAG: hypothetical protein ABSD31_20270 [Candidatus Binataceae bacterium]|jgi:hypothetical protein
MSRTISVEELRGLRDELRRRFEPFGARVEGFELQTDDTLFTWIGWAYTTEAAEGLFHEWRSKDRSRQLTVFIVRDDKLVTKDNKKLQRHLFDRGDVPTQITQDGIWDLLRELGLEQTNPLIIQRKL